MSPKKHKTKQPFDAKNSLTAIHPIDTPIFRWTILAEDYIFWAASFRKQSLKNFIEETVKKLNHYSKMKWGDILKDRHNHKIEISNTACEGAFKNLIAKKKESENPIEEKDFYQLAIDDKHRLIGYRNNGVFYVFMNDPEHKVYPY